MEEKKKKIKAKKSLAALRDGRLTFCSLKWSLYDTLRRTGGYPDEDADRIHKFFEIETGFIQRALQIRPCKVLFLLWSTQRRYDHAKKSSGYFWRITRICTHALKRTS